MSGRWTISRHHGNSPGLRSRNVEQKALVVKMAPALQAHMLATRSLEQKLAARSIGALTQELEPGTHSGSREEARGP